MFNGLDLLTDTNKLLKPSLAYITPSQTVCNYWTLTFRNLANATSEGNSNGHWLEFHLLRAAGRAEQREHLRQRAGQRPGERGKPPPLQPVPADRGARVKANVCEAGNEKYVTGETVIGHAPELCGGTRRHPRAGEQMSRLPERDRRAAAAGSGRIKWRPSNVADRDHLHPHLHDRALPGLHQTRAVHQLRLRSQRDLLQLGQHRPQLAGPDRRRRRRQSRSRPNATATTPRSPSPSTAPAGRSTTTPSPRSGRGSSSRATSSSNSTPAAPARRRWTAAARSRSAAPRPRSRSTKSSPPCSRRSAPTSAACWRATAPRSPTNRPPPKTLTQLPEVQRQDRRRSPQRRLPVRRRRRPLQRPGDQRPARHPAAATSRASSPAPAAPSAPSPAASADLQGLIVNFDVFTGALANQSTNLSTTIHLLAPTLKITHASLVSLNRSLPPLRTYAIELTPGGRRAARPDRRLETLARPGPAAALRQGGRRRRQAAGRIDPRPRRRRPGRQADDPAAAQPAQPLHLEGDGADRQPGDQRPFSTGRPNYREFLYTLVNFAGDGAELRRQRPLRPGPGRRRAGPGRRTEPERQPKPPSAKKSTTRTRSKTRSGPSRSSAGSRR